MVFLKTHILLPATCVPAHVGPVFHNLRNDVGGQACAAIQDVDERGEMLSLVRADATGVANGLAVAVPLRVSFLNRRSSADEHRHHAVVPQPIPTPPDVYGSFKRSVSFHSLVEGGPGITVVLGLA